MPRHVEISIAQQVKLIPSSVRPIVQAARRTVKAIAPIAKEIAYQSQPPRSKSAMWKIVRYAVGDEPVVGIGTFSTYATLFFYRGRELNDAGDVLEGSGRDSRFTRLRSRSDAARPDVRRLIRQAFALERDQTTRS
jgi:hypothetical protein